MDSPIIKHAKIKAVIPTAFSSTGVKYNRKNLEALQRRETTRQFGFIGKAEPRKNFLVEKPLVPNILDVAQAKDVSETTIPKNKRFTNTYF